MKFQTPTLPLRELVEKFHRGSILLPQFQRDYVWRPKKIRNLLDSLLKGFPIGGFYLWRPTSGTRDPKPKANDNQAIAPDFAGYLIDGQQRLTSLEAAFGLYTGEDKGGIALRCYLDLSAKESDGARDTRLFLSYGGSESVARRVEAGDPTLLPISRLFKGRDYDFHKEVEEGLGSLSGWSAKRVEGALQRLDQAYAMLDQSVPCTTIYDVSDRDAVEVFNRLNKGGSPLRQGDVRAAELARGSTVNVLKKMREFVVRPTPIDLGFGFSFAFRALVVFHREAAQFATLKPDWMDTPGPYGRTLMQSWNITEKALEKALSFVDERMGWSRQALLPSTNAVIVLASAFDKDNLKITTESEQLYRQWLCLIALRGVFQGSVETTINRFLRPIREAKKGAARVLNDALRRHEGRRLRGEDFNSYGQVWGPATQVIHSWLVGKEAKDWLSGELLDNLARNGSSILPGGDVTVHHIFPRRVLSDVRDNPDDANKPANYAMLSRPTNSEFGKERPEDILSKLTPEQRKLAAEQFFGEAAGDRLRYDRYDEFCEWRADRLAQSINVWLGLDRV